MTYARSMTATIRIPVMSGLYGLHLARTKIELAILYYVVVARTPI
jgi:hypothetical protein